jgi:hypothetical protein
VIRSYEPAHEQSWLRCRVLAFLDTAYFDSVEREKEPYDQPAIELVEGEGGERFERVHDCNLLERRL